MGEEDRSAVVLGSIDDDRAQWEFHAACVTLMARQVKTPSLIVEVDDP